MGLKGGKGGASAPKVRIVGGGITGILAAFEAHAQGARDIELHDRFDQLGGQAVPRMAHGVELRESDLMLGPAGDPVRRLLEAHGISFDEVENRRGSVTAAGDDLTFTRDFCGPAYRSRTLDLAPTQGESLADRIRAYPDDIAQPLARFCQWRLGAWLDEVHADTARSLGVARVYPLGHEPVEVAAAKRAAPAADDLFGLPAALWGRLQGLTAGVPVGGYSAFFMRVRQTLTQLGVRIVTPSFATPHAALAAREPDEVVVWAADPRPLFKPIGLEAPKPEAHSLVTYILKVRYTGPVPLEVRNFTAQGQVIRVRLYESHGQVLLAAECLSEVRDGDLRREIHRLMAGFGGAALTLGETASIRFEPRWNILTLADARKLSHLRAALARSEGAAFVAPRWEEPDPTRRHAELALSLAQALQSPGEAAKVA